jgi:hypothetical protein
MHEDDRPVDILEAGLVTADEKIDAVIRFQQDFFGPHASGRLETRRRTDPGRRSDDRRRFARGGVVFSWTPSVPSGRGPPLTNTLPGNFNSL